LLKNSSKDLGALSSDEKNDFRASNNFKILSIAVINDSHLVFEWDIPGHWDERLETGKNPEYRDVWQP
jgi:hypothetical protein